MSNDIHSYSKTSVKMGRYRGRQPVREGLTDENGQTYLPRTGEPLDSLIARLKERDAVIQSKV